MAKTQRVHIVGIGDDGLEGLTGAARRLIQNAEVLVGTKQTLSVVSNADCELVEVAGDYDLVAQRIAACPDKRIVVLTSGDPLFYGVARYMCDKLGKDRFEVLPHVSSMQLAFARVKESWEEAYLANLATVDLPRVVEKIRIAEKAGLFTTDDVTPAQVARALVDRGIDYFTAYVCENLGSPDERVTTCGLTEVAEQEFAPLNVMILIRQPNVPDRPQSMIGHRLFGNPDDLFLQSQPKRGLLTPMEIRTLALAELDIGPRSVVWDVGAGSGAVAVEAAQIAASGMVYAIEMDAEDYQLIAANAERFAVPNLVPKLGQAPDAWADLPDPDAVFVGGTGRMVSRIFELALDRLQTNGRIVANVNNLNNLVAVHAAARRRTTEVHVRMINIAHATDQLEDLGFESRNPTFLITAVKPD